MKAEEALFEKLVASLREEFGADLVGVLVTGSRIHGEPGRTSDLDVHVVITPPRRQRRNRVIDGVEVEMFINPPFQIRRYFRESRDDGTGIDQHMFAFGRAIYDPHGTIAVFQDEARAQWQAGPPPIPPREAWQHRYGPADLLRDLDDLGSADEATAVLLITRAADQLIRTHYRLQGRWPVKLKRRLSDLQTWDPTAARLARSVLDRQPVAHRRAALAELARYVLSPLGGLMPLEWESDWEELPMETEVPPGAA